MVHYDSICMWRTVAVDRHSILSSKRIHRIMNVYLCQTNPSPPPPPLLLLLYFTLIFDGVFAVAIWFGVYVRTSTLGIENICDIFGSAVLSDDTIYFYGANTWKHSTLSGGDMEHRTSSIRYNENHMTCARTQHSIHFLPWRATIAAVFVWLSLVPPHLYSDHSSTRISFANRHSNSWNELGDDEPRNVETKSEGDSESKIIMFSTHDFSHIFSKPMHRMRSQNTQSGMQETRKKKMNRKMIRSTKMCR